MIESLERKNLSTWILYPMFNLPKEGEEYFQNTFVNHSDSSFNGLIGSLYILYKFSGRISNLFDSSQPYLELESKLIQREEYQAHYDINNGEYVLFCMIIPDLYEKDYEYFLEGKYSKIRRKPEEYKENCTPAYTLINQRWKDNGVMGVNIKNIMDKSSLFKKQFEAIKGIEIPEGAEVYSSYQDSNIQAKETFNESSLIFKNRF